MLNHPFSIFAQIRRFLGALRSRNPAAYLGILLKAIGPLTHLFDQMIYSFSNSNKTIIRDIPPCVMIVGPPRSGSTVVYQVLARTIPCVYFSNTHSLFPNYASGWMKRRALFGANLRGCKNYYGYSASLFDTNEGNQIIAALIKENADRKIIRERFAKLIAVMQATHYQPFIFKNVRGYPYLMRIKEAIPEIIFLRIKRNREDVIQSVVSAYHELGTFHPIPDSLRISNIREPVEFAVRQILEIEKTIDAQREKIEKDSWLEWSYEDFCLNPWPMVERLASDYLDINTSRLRKDALPALRISKRVKVKANEAKRISFLLDMYSNRSLLS
jgi:hypothetical protein